MYGIYSGTTSNASFGLPWCRGCRASAATSSSPHSPRRSILRNSLKKELTINISTLKPSPHGKAVVSLHGTLDKIVTYVVLCVCVCMCEGICVRSCQPYSTRSSDTCTRSLRPPSTARPSRNSSATHWRETKEKYRR